MRLRLLILACLLAVSPPAPAEEVEELDRELELDKQDADFPDLVRVDEVGGVMDEFALLEDAEVVYTAAKHKQDIGESPSAITVITREQIESTYCTDLICLLRQVPEVDVVRIKPMYASVGARALTDEVGEKVLLIVDGRELNNEIFGIPFWQLLPIHLEDIEHIEVIRGPGSALYGANAHSMVVSVFTRKIDADSFQLFLGSGEHDRSSLHLRAGQNYGSWNLQLTGGLDTAGHWQLWSLRERECGRIRMHMDHHDDASKTRAQIGLQYGEGNIYSALGPAVMQDMLLVDLTASHETDWLKGSLSFSYTDAAIYIEIHEVYFEGIHLGEVPDTVPFFATDLDGQVQASWRPFEGNLMISGANLRWITAISDKIDPSHLHQLRAGLFIHDEQRLAERILVTGGVRFDYNTITPFTISPRLAGVYEFTDNQFLRLAFGQAFRKPSFFNSSIHITDVQPQLAFPALGDFFREAVGNENLKNESITSFEAGYRGRLLNARLTVEADAFYNRYRDTINMQVEMINDDWGLPDLANSQAKYSNRGREADTIGGSVSLVYHLQNSLRVGANYTYRYSWYTSEPGVGAADGEGKKGDRVNWEPAHLGNFTFSYVPQNGLRLGIGWHGSSAKRGYVNATGSTWDPKTLVPLSASWFISAYLAWRVDFRTSWLELGVRAYNLLQTHYRDIPGITDKTWVRDYRLGPEQIGRRIFLFLRGSI